MPDPVQILQAMGAAALTAAAIFLLCGWLGSGRPGWVCAGSILGIAIGFFVGCWVYEIRPHWPPTDVKDRLLLVLLPTVVVVELAAVLPGAAAWLAWPLRVVLVAGTTRVLLHKSVYLATEPDADTWTTAQAWANLGGWAAALAGVWVLLALLARRTGSRSIPLAVALACAGAGPTIMFSGYASGGPIGLMLGGALTGALVASFLVKGPPDPVGLLGVGVVGFFGLIVAAHFLGNLNLVNAALLFFAPLLCWLPELPPRFRAVWQILLVALPVAVALWLAQQKFSADSMKTADGGQDLYGQPAGGIDYGK